MNQRASNQKKYIIVVYITPVGHCEESRLSGTTKPCPEQSEGTHEIATGFALATTFHAGLPRPLGSQ
jgi:hypothetical protein